MMFRACSLYQEQHYGEGCQKPSETIVFNDDAMGILTDVLKSKQKVVTRALVLLDILSRYYDDQHRKKKDPERIEREQFLRPRLTDMLNALNFRQQHLQTLLLLEKDMNISGTIKGTLKKFWDVDSQRRYLENYQTLNERVEATILLKQILGRGIPTTLNESFMKNVQEKLTRLRGLEEQST